MSVVTVQMGQCGNQLGYEFFSSLAEDMAPGSGSMGAAQESAYQAAASDRFFHADKEGVLSARAVMVDMEPKVIIL